jgi:hypothetical protein
LWEVIVNARAAVLEKCADSDADFLDWLRGLTDETSPAEGRQ